VGEGRREEARQPAELSAGWDAERAMMSEFELLCCDEVKRSASRSLDQLSKRLYFICARSSSSLQVLRSVPNFCILPLLAQVILTASVFLGKSK